MMDKKNRMITEQEVTVVFLKFMDDELKDYIMPKFVEALTDIGKQFEEKCVHKYMDIVFKEILPVTTKNELKKCKQELLETDLFDTKQWHDIVGKHSKNAIDLIQGECEKICDKISKDLIA